MSTYTAVHRRLYAARGRAIDQLCVADDCGEQPRHWAYLYNGDPELQTKEGKKFATDIHQCYAPMCIKHHRRFDRDHEPERYAFYHSLPNRPPRTFTPEKESEIKALYVSGHYSQDTLAVMYGVGQATISRIVARAK